ncbi:transglycosylase domain-containing protein [Photobacterium sp. 1_MG-2023]|uniref:transglycosylase domain-containing protein n=1 Tax=Photobacterium sp. 1_MG-2023 TaxID=3062646 RepID=UPI0026E2ADB1|nr:transglycosylase domain-containing protein [Photobacterium sp. 1_MG-2023]MDO6707591.1 transglycosylase domain-containing protein [Photobacterium sp. 1_MG-2023]
MEGNGVIGMEAAAMAYYGKKTSQLTDDEFYGLIAMPIAPNYYHPVSNPEVHAKRVQRIKVIVSGQCAASGWFDLTYEHCASGV